MRRIALLYCASGMAALAVETVWMRWLRLLLGATAPAASATLVAFFTGHALGAAWGAWRATAWSRPLRVYGGLQLGAAVCGLAVPLLLRVGGFALAPLYDGLRETPALLTLWRYGIALAATLPAAFCFGATFPAVGAAAVGAVERLGSRGSALYALNTLGAAMGTALAAFVLPGLIGVRATYGLALALSAGVGLLALALASTARHRQAERTASQPRAEPNVPSAQERGSLLGARALLALAALSGFGSFALQVLLVQSFAQVLNQSVIAFGAVLVTVLCTITAGAALVAWLERAARLDPRTLLGYALAGAALALAALPAWLHRVTNGLEYVGSDRPGVPYLLAALSTVATTAGPALLAVALILPATFALAARRGGAGESDARGTSGTVLGRLVALNTVGAIAGSLAAPYLLLPWAGPWASFAALALLYAAAAIAVPEASVRRRLRRDGLLAVGWVVVLVRASPLAVPAVRLETGERLLGFESTPAGVVAVLARGEERLLRIDNHYVLGGTAERVHEERQGHLPLLLHPEARRVAFVGTATGITAAAALAHPVTRIHLVEIVPGVVQAARRFFGAANRGIYDDRRSVVVLDDARNFLGATRELFDVVVADLFVPWRSGTGSLYTLEHFEAVRDRLAPAGLFCQWLPLYQLGEEELRILVASFVDVFPRAALFRGDFYGGYPIVALVGWTGTPAPAAAVSAAAGRLAARNATERWLTDPTGLWALYVTPLGPLAPALAAGPRNTDDRPRIELLAARGHAGGRRGKERPVVGVAWVRFAEALRAAVAPAGDALYPALPDPARRAVEGGAALQEAGALWVADRRQAAARRFGEAAALLPPHLIADAPADPTAAELWHADR